MKIWKQVSEIFRKPSAPAVRQSNRETYLRKYQLFRELLSHNNEALELMADMEETSLRRSPSGQVSPVQQSCGNYRAGKHYYGCTEPDIKGQV